MRNWLSDDAVQEKDDTGWGLPLWWGVAIVALFIGAVSLCNSPDDTDDAAGAAPATTTAPRTTVAPRPGGPNLVDVIDTRPELSFFRGLITTAGLDEAIAAGTDDITFFAPTDTAFAALPEELIAAMAADPNVAVQVLRIHVAQGKLTLTDLIALGSVDTAIGMTLPVTEQDGATHLDLAAVVDSDLAASNGMVHTIDAAIGLDDHAGAPPEPESPGP